MSTILSNFFSSLGSQISDVSFPSLSSGNEMETLNNFGADRFSSVLKSYLTKDPHNSEGALSSIQSMGPNLSSRSFDSGLQSSIPSLGSLGPYIGSSINSQGLSIDDLLSITELPSESFKMGEMDLVGLRLSDMHIGDMGAMMVSQRLMVKGKEDTILFLKGNEISERGTYALSSALKSNNKVKHLVLSDNKITDFAAAALADMLKVNHTVGWVILNNNMIGHEGAEAIADSLKTNPSVKHLILTDNHVGDKGAVALGDLLHENTPLESLFLKSNSIGIEGVDALISGLEFNTNLKLLQLTDNDFTADQIGVLRDLADEKGFYLKIT